MVDVYCCLWWLVVMCWFYVDFIGGLRGLFVDCFCLLHWLCV